MTHFRSFSGKSSGSYPHLQISLPVLTHSSSRIIHEKSLSKIITLSYFLAEADLLKREGYRLSGKLPRNISSTCTRKRTFGLFIVVVPLRKDLSPVHSLYMSYGDMTDVYSIPE